MQCPNCQQRTRVIETRAAEDGAATRRRRRCDSCGERFTTVERPEARLLFVRKRDGSRERFDREKLLAGLLRAAHKRPVDRVAIEQLADRIAAAIAGGGGELTASEIGDLALEGLGALDRVAYLQFAAVYKSFTDPAEFSAELAEFDSATDPTAAVPSLGSVRPSSNPA